MKYEETKNAIIGGLFIMFFAYSLEPPQSYILLQGNLTSLEDNLTQLEQNSLEQQIQIENLQKNLNKAEVDLNNAIFIAEELTESVGRNISTVKDCIELVEEVRYQAACLLYYTSNYSSDELYDWCDSIVYDNEVSDETRD